MIYTPAFDNKAQFDDYSNPILEALCNYKYIRIENGNINDNIVIEERPSLWQRFIRLICPCLKRNNNFNYISEFTLQFLECNRQHLQGHVKSLLMLQGRWSKVSPDVSQRLGRLVTDALIGAEAHKQLEIMQGEIKQASEKLSTTKNELKIEEIRLETARTRKQETLDATRREVDEMIKTA